jgi:hypothetical protein
LSAKIIVALLVVGALFGGVLDRFVLHPTPANVPADTVHVYHPIKYVSVPKIVYKKVFLHDTTYTDSSKQTFRVLSVDTLLGGRRDTLKLAVYPDALPPYLDIDFRPAPVPVRIDSVVVTHFVSVNRPINPYSVGETVLGGAVIAGSIEKQSLIGAGVGAGLVILGIFSY